MTCRGMLAGGGVGGLRKKWCRATLLKIKEMIALAQWSIWSPRIQPPLKPPCSFCTMILVFKTQHGQGHTLETNHYSLEIHFMTFNYPLIKMHYYQTSLSDPRWSFICYFSLASLVYILWNTSSRLILLWPKYPLTFTGARSLHSKPFTCHLFKSCPSYIFQGQLLEDNFCFFFSPNRY